MTPRRAMRARCSPQLGAPLTVHHEVTKIHTALGLVAAGLIATLVSASVTLQALTDVFFTRSSAWM